MKHTTVIESLINAQETPAVIINREFRIVAANKAYCLSYGIDPDEIVGHCCHQVSHHSDVPCFKNGEDCPHREVLTSNSPFEVLHTHYDYANRPDRVRIKAYPIETSNGDRLVMETINRLAPSMHLTCEEMRMVGRSPVFLKFLESLNQAARSFVPVLLHGETGVGKEMAAQHIHENSSRRGKPYVELNCAAIPETLFESELFGHERGAFTGCAGLKRGLFETADKGTLFLDEIGEMPLSMQAKLLRVLDSGEFRRLGGTSLLQADVRILAATNRDLPAMVAQGKFREDLYFRIAGIKVQIPPLRERRNDIPALADALIHRLCQRNKTNHCHLTKEAIEYLMQHDFPGNVRELMNVLQQAVALSPDGVVDVDHIRFNDHHCPRNGQQHSAFGMPSDSNPQAGTSYIDPSLTRAEAEARHIAELLHRHQHNRRVVATALGISDRTLYRKIKRYQLYSNGEIVR